MAASSTAEAEVLCRLAEVQLHQVKNGADQLLATAPLIVSVVNTNGGSTVTVQVGQCKWPLDRSLPTLKSTESAFMFAMPNEVFYSVLLPIGLPEEDVALWEVLLEECTSYQPQPELTSADREKLQSQVSEDLMQPGALDPTVPDTDLVEEDAPAPHMTRIASGSAKVQEKIAWGADWASRKMMEASERLQASSNPREKPIQVSERTQANIRRARTVAAHGAAGAAKVAGGITDISVRIADTMIRKLGRTKDAEGLADPNASPQKKQSAVRDVAAASVLAALEIYDSMEAAALVVTKAGGDATSGYVTHKYGEQAGQASRDVAAMGYSGVSTVRSVSQIRRLGATSVARKVARRTAKGIVKSWVKPVEIPVPDGTKPPLPAGQGGPGASYASPSKV